MTHISLISDLHLELSEAPTLNGGDILLVAGDTWSAAHIENRGALRRRFEAFCKKELSKYGLVFLVHGNHEFYGSTLEETPRIIREFVEDYAPNVIVLNNSSHTIGNICFIGSTFWATHGVGEPGSDIAIGTHLADFREIRVGDRLPFTPKAANALHQRAIAYLRKELTQQKQQGRRCIVITHHAPSYKSKAGRHYALNLDAAFYADQEALVEDHPQIALWCHGHSHASCRYQIGEAAIVSNQRGYYPGALSFDPNAADFSLDWRGRCEFGPA